MELIQESDINTQKWYCFNKKLENIKKVMIEYEVACENVRKEGKQFNSCFIGFLYVNDDLEKNFKS
jgi:hypothetical protein